jgi:hypothetical protein
MAENPTAQSELDPEAIGLLLDLPVPLVLRRMDDGRLPFRREGQRRLAKIEDVTRLMTLEDVQTETLRALAEMEDVDYQPEPRL